MASCVRYGCKKPECMEARRKSNRANYHGLKEGGARVSSEEAHRHALGLVSAGMSAQDIAARSGVSVTQVRRLLRGALPGVLRVNSDAILGVIVPDEHTSMTDGLADATGAMRRLRALSVQGFSTTVVSQESGIVRLAISEIRSGDQSRLRVSTLRSIVALHEKFWDTDPLDLGVALSSVVRTKNYAEKQKWWPTEAWDDIDAPECRPSLKTPRYVALTEDARELINEYGYTRKEAAERLGVKTDTLTSAMIYYDKVKST